MERVEGEPLRKGTARLAESLDALKSSFHSDNHPPPSFFTLLQPSLKITFFPSDIRVSNLLWLSSFPSISKNAKNNNRACRLSEWFYGMKMLEPSPQWGIKASGLWKPGSRAGRQARISDPASEWIPLASCDLEMLWLRDAPTGATTKLFVRVGPLGSFHVICFVPNRAAGFFGSHATESKREKIMQHRPHWASCGSTTVLSLAKQTR